MSCTGIYLLNYLQLLMQDPLPISILWSSSLKKIKRYKIHLSDRSIRFLFLHVDLGVNQSLAGSLLFMYADHQADFMRKHPCVSCSSKFLDITCYVAIMLRSTFKLQTFVSPAEKKNKIKTSPRVLQKNLGGKVRKMTAGHQPPFTGRDCLSTGLSGPQLKGAQE